SRIAESSSSVSIIDFLRGKRQAFERPWFQAQFDNKRSRELDGVKAITGATISSKAVIDSVKLKASQIYSELTNGR
ncbi:MAG: FMN-binding protein, partial [Candidatus Omnitrophica bacterium]|nr:FMN-binding protein [Candidatus Omnitrophota bacterium]